MNERCEQLIDLVIDGEADAEAWAELTGHAERDPALWRRIAESQRDHAILTYTVERAALVADGVEAPDRENPFLRRGAAAWLGWAAAAVILIAWMGKFQQPVQPNDELPIQTAGMTPLSSEQYFDKYMEQGRTEQLVVQELPERILIDTRPLPSGDGYELLYLRQIVERRIVPELYEMRGEDDAGRPSFVRYQRPAGQSM